MHSEIDISEFWCWNERCPDHGKKGRGNIRVRELRGKDKRALLLCKTCGCCFSETKGTPFFGLKTPIEEVVRALSMLPERGSIRSVGRSTKHKPDTIIEWIRVAGAHAKEVNDYMLRDLELDRVQVDEIWAFIKKRRKTSSLAKKG